MAGSARLQDKVAFITGANQGIGTSIALAFADEGAHAMLSDVNQDNLPAVVHALRAKGVEAESCELDVSDPAQVQAGVAKAIERFGHIDILVNNAGIYQSAPLADYALEDWNRLISINVTGVFLVTQAVARHMVQRKQGKIINLSSVAGRVPSLNSIAYNTSKHAVIGITRCSALELAPHGITANAICPGMVDTEMFDNLLEGQARIRGRGDAEQLRAARLKVVPIGRMIQPDEIARLAVFLAADEAGGMNGQAIPVDGGLAMV